MTDYTPEEMPAQRAGRPEMPPPEEEETYDDTPAEQLKKRQKELEEAQSEKENLDKRIEHLKSNITDLTKAVTEIEKNTKDWEKASQEIKQKKAVEDTYYKTSRAGLEENLSEEEKRRVTQAKTAEERRIRDLEAKVERLRKTIAEQEKQLDTAKANTAAKKQQYADLVNLAKTDNDYLKDLAALHASADKEEEKNNTLRMYYLVLEMGEVLDKVKVPSVEEYREDVNEAGSAVSDASVKEQEAKDAVDKSRAELKKAEKDLSDAKANRRATILNAIGENVNPSAPTE